MLDLVKVARNLNDKRVNVRVIVKNDDKIIIGTEFWCIEFREPNKIPKSFQNALYKHFNVKELKEIPVDGLGSMSIEKYLDGINNVLEASLLRDEVKEVNIKDINENTKISNSLGLDIVELKAKDSDSVYLDSNLYSMIKDIENYKITVTHRFGMVVFKNENSKVGILPLRV